MKEMAKEILLFPFGGNARESLISILAINNVKREWNILGFIDDDPSLLGKDCCGVKVIGGREILRDISGSYILALPGNPKNYLKRKDIIDSLNLESSRFTTIIHPSAKITADSKIGYNTIIMPNVVISCGVSIGNHCIVLPNTVISHDSIVGDYCCVGSNVAISGYVVIGSNCYIGSGANIKENIHIGRGTLIGLGSNVISNIEENSVVVGNPAKFLTYSK
jgi:sugar O-acyltransferase (sialic acid O-acetyltransferase NeuD family)